MRITNKFGLPGTLMRMIERDTYTKGSAKISVTGMISSPRVAALRRKHFTSMESDVSDHLWRLMGQAISMIAERGASNQYITEQRLFGECLGWILSGALDLQEIIDGDTVDILDYKFTSTWAVMSDKPEWENQLNCYAWLVRNQQAAQYGDGVPIPNALTRRSVRNLKDVAILRDWREKAGYGKPDYPKAPIVSVDVKRWTDAEQDAYVAARIQAHQDLAFAEEFGGAPPVCTPEERWHKTDKFAVEKVGRKTAMRVLDSQDEADKWVADNTSDEKGAKIKTKDAAKISITMRPGEDTRCAGDYCGVSAWCDWWAANGPQQPEEVHNG